MKSFQQFMKENEAQDDKIDSVENEKSEKQLALKKKLKDKEENQETADRLDRISNLEAEVQNIKQNMSWHLCYNTITDHYFMFSLRPDPQDAFDTMRLYDKGQLIMPTGSGKTLCMIFDAMRE